MPPGKQILFISIEPVETNGISGANGDQWGSMGIGAN
jgi:hypothetical protein